MTVIAYLATPIDAHYLRTLLIGLDATVTVNADGVLVIAVPDSPASRTTTTTPVLQAFRDWSSSEDQAYDEKPCPACGGTGAVGRPDDPMPCDRCGR